MQKDFIEPYYNKLIKDTMDSDTGLPRIHLIQNNEFLNETKDDIDRNKVENHVKNIIEQWNKYGYKFIHSDGTLLETPYLRDMITNRTINYICRELRYGATGAVISIHFMKGDLIKEISNVCIGPYINKMATIFGTLHESAHILQRVYRLFQNQPERYIIDTGQVPIHQTSEKYFCNELENHIWWRYKTETHADLFASIYILLDIMLKDTDDKSVFISNVKYILLKCNNFNWMDENKYGGYNALPILVNILSQPRHVILEQFNDCINDDKSIDIYKLFNITKDLVFEKEEEYRTWFVQNNVRMSLILNIRAIRSTTHDLRQSPVSNETIQNLELDMEECLINFNKEKNPLFKDKINIGNFRNSNKKNININYLVSTCIFNIKAKIKKIKYNFIDLAGERLEELKITLFEHEQRLNEVFMKYSNNQEPDVLLNKEQTNNIASILDNILPNKYAQNFSKTH